MEIREAKSDEFLKVIELAKNCKPLEVYPEHLYKIIFRYFKDLCVVAEDKGELIGFAMGFSAQNPDKTCFFWQIGVNPKVQAKGLGKKIVSYFEKKAKNLGYNRIELTVDLENIPSQKLFEKLDYENASKKEEAIVSKDGKIAARDFYGPGRHFIVYAKTV
ncbi:MAG: GNAT family N-acetyltransferase [Candidatus Omnitrophica bacterium]|nr:GNAT family N-acetyltransferase [Candidatus Omnitrophota bacterium]MCF7876793.1 GNAT family N-acetyltransferase [Candidatus Omnitrophota bacterium]MCF7878239.1 GNAT family N-acetyltransferase [Candidatus Omnitrophota bacterium]